MKKKSLRDFISCPLKIKWKKKHSEIIKKKKKNRKENCNSLFQLKRVLEIPH